MTTVNTDVIDRIIFVVVITAAATGRCMTSHSDDVTGHNMPTLVVSCRTDTSERLVVKLWLAERDVESTVTAE